MERQLQLKLTDREERAANFDAYFTPMNFQARELAILRLVYLDGTAYRHYGERASELRISQNSLAKMANLSKDTIRKAIDFLVSEDLLRIEKASEPWAYVVNWIRLADWTPPPVRKPVAPNDIFHESWSPPVAPGRPARAVNNRVSNPRVTRVPVSYTGAPTEGDHVDDDRGEPVRLLPPMPWSNLTSDDLVAAVCRGDLPLLRHLWDELLAMSRKGVAGWPTRLADDDSTRWRFLALAHHAARVKRLGKVKSAMGVLTTAVKDNLDVSRITDESEDWAWSILRTKRRDPDLTERLCDAGSERISHVR